MDQLGRYASHQTLKQSLRDLNDKTGALQFGMSSDFGLLHGTVGRPLIDIFLHIWPDKTSAD